MAGNYKIPFDEKGGMVQDACRARWYAKEWRENYEFDATMRLDRELGDWVTVRDEMDHEYYISMHNLFPVLVRGTITEGKISGRWTFVKRGNSYSLKPAGRRSD